MTAHKQLISINNGKGKAPPPSPSPYQHWRRAATAQARHRAIATAIATAPAPRLKRATAFPFPLFHQNAANGAVPTARGRKTVFGLFPNCQMFILSPRIIHYLPVKRFEPQRESRLRIRGRQIVEEALENS